MVNRRVTRQCRTALLGLVAAAVGCGTKSEAPKIESQARIQADAAPKAEVKSSVKAAAVSASVSSGAAKATRAKSGVVFDPRNPPPGFTKCHRNHCHRAGGGVASYQQVMDEIGATSAVNVPTSMPPAPAGIASVPTDAIKTESGLAMKILSPGKGNKPDPEATVVFHYTAWSLDGKGLKSSVANGEPAMAPLPRVNVKGLAEALKLMTPGEERRLWVPEKLAFEGRPGKPRGMIVFDVELLRIR